MTEYLSNLSFIDFLEFIVGLIGGLSISFIRFKKKSKDNTVTQNDNVAGGDIVGRDKK
ncbi:MAG: hypothetical protein WD059_08070 [Balneolaceae bacterium]